MSRYLACSFVTKRPGRKGGLDYWNVKPSGDYAEDWRRGELMALEALEVMALPGGLSADPSGDLLASVALAMPRSGDHTGVELGFLNCIGHFAAIAQRNFGDKHYRDFIAQSQRVTRELYAKMKADCSERARKAAQARWAKRDLERLAGEVRS